jgi:large subunit ribosomal protein L25
MSNTLNITAEERVSKGKSNSRNLRNSNLIPAVIYGGALEAQKIQLLEKDLVKATQTSGFSSQVLKINLDGKDQDVVLKELQLHPSSQKLIHADFLRVDPDTRITLTIPLHFINEDICAGVKVEGGVVSHLINNIEISCLASNLPEFIEVDVENLEIGDTLTLSQLKLGEGVEIPALALGENRDQAVVSVAEAKIIDIEPIEPEEIEGEGEEGEGEGEESEPTSSENLPTENSSD